MTPQQARAEVDRLLQLGQIDQEVATTMMARFAVTGNIYDQPQEQAIAPEVIAASEQLAAGTNTKKERKALLTEQIDDLASANDQRLLDITNSDDVVYNDAMIKAAQDQIEERARIQGLSFFKAITDPDALARMGKTALKGPAQTVNALVNGIPGLAGLAIGADEFAADQFTDLMENNEAQNKLFGVSDPIRAEESLAEVITSAFVPGGFGVKAVSVATDFSVDQTIRELTDEKDSSYETVFDRTGVLSDSAESFTLSPLVAAPIAIVSGLVTAQGVKSMRGAMAIKPPTLAEINDFDKFAPPGLKTLETSGDAMTAYVLSETQALTNIVERAGVPNIDDISKTLTLNGHASANVRAREAVNSGFTVVDGKTYQVPVSVKNLYDAASALPFEIKKKLERYLNAKDLLDDVRIAAAKNLPGNHSATEARLLREIAVNAAGVPNIRQFERGFQMATQAARDFLDGSLLTPAQKLWLDTNRKHYVPRNTSSVDPQAPFMTRMIQTQKEGDVEADEWFLNNRNSSGNLDLDSMGSPFEQLAGYTESALRAVMKNNSKVSVIDAVMNSQFGKETMKLVDDTIDIAGNQDRLVTVFRNGEKETYITSALQAQLLRFDPYVAKHPTLFAVKRLAEWNTVGPGSIVFAPVTAIRDTIGALVLRNKDTVAAGPLQVAAAVPKQLWARAQQGIAANIYAGVASGKQYIPESIIPRATRLAYANKLSNQYLNSLYHLSNQSGGFDGSIMRSNVEYAKNAIGEIKRSLSESTMLHHPALDNMVTRFGRAGAGVVIDGFLALFDSVQNAPRFAALEATVKSGKNIDDATLGARAITGDVSQSGRVFRPDGRVMRADAVKQGVTTYVTPGIGRVANLARESTPFFNPMVQGLRNVIGSFKTDPAGTMGRAWLYAGLPALTAYSWNEMMGEEYNDYAMSRRSAQDVAMNMYVAIPGLPPEQGIEIPMMHELLLFSSPYTRMLHGLLEGENRQEMSTAMQTLGSTILGNSLEVATPTVLSAFSNITGNRSPDGIFSMGEAGAIREDNVGFLPQNIEQLSRTLFASNGDTAIQLAYSMAGDSDLSFNDFLGSVYTSVAKRAPVVKNLAGLKTANVSFSIPAEYDRKVEEAMGEFWTYYSVHTKAQNDDGFTKPATSTKDYTKDQGAMKGREDLPFLMIGPDTLAEPLNPLYPVVGQILYDLVRTNDIGVSGLDDRSTKYTKYISQLKKYNIGDRDAIAEWQTRLEGLETSKDPETLELKNWLGQFNLDLTTYEDRVKLINIIENEKSYILRQKVELVQSAEQVATEKLIAEGMLQPGEKFSIIEHMDPMDENPLQK